MPEIEGEQVKYGADKFIGKPADKPVEDIA
jgi:hypothetical protein